MLTFNQTYLRDPFIKPIKRVVYKCHLYELKQNDQAIAKLYFGEKFSFIDLPGKPMLLERDRFMFKKDKYLLTDFNTGEQICYFKFPAPGVAFNLFSSAIWFANQSVYTIKQNKSHRQLFKPSTWKQHRFDMQGNNDHVSYFGKSSGARMSGEITTNNTEIIIPIITGLFVIDEKFRRDEESPA